MAVLCCKSAVLVFMVSGLIIQHNPTTAAQCDLEKIFRTPRDMSNTNFDHFEIVERNGYYTEPITTTTEPSQTTEIKGKENRDNIANAQILLRFGGDIIGDSSHIMRIPPQLRHVASHVLPHQYPNPYYQHPYLSSYSPHPHYYHPYPPPVPYMFPNYYFCNYAEEFQNLPHPLREYFRTHGQFSGEQGVFIKDRPTGSYGIQTDFADGRNPQSKNLPNPNLAVLNETKINTAVPTITPRNLQTLNLTNEDIKKPTGVKIKIDAYAVEKKAKGRKNVLKENNRNVDSSEEQTSKNHYKHDKKDKKSEEWLLKSLVAYKCPNCTGPPKMLVSYPINNQNDLQPILFAESCPHCKTRSEKFPNDIDKLGIFNTGDVIDTCKCLQCQCNKKDKKFSNDMDDLLMVIAEIIDPNDELLKTPKKEQKSLIYKLAKIGLELADADLSNPLQISPKVSLDLELGNSDGNFPIKETSIARCEHNQPKMSHSISSESNLCGVKYYQAPTEVETVEVYDHNIDHRINHMPEFYYVDRNPTKNYRSPNSHTSPSVYHNRQYTYPVSLPRECFYPESNVYVKRPAESQLPKYVKVIPRPDLEIIPNNIPKALIVDTLIDSSNREKSNYCKKCGHTHTGKNFCDNCGNPIALYSKPSRSYSCSACAKETKQLNDW